jgi:hypothetical protein
MSVAPASGDGPRRRRNRLLLAAMLVLLLIALAVALLVRRDVVQSTSVSNGVQGSGVAATEARDVASFRAVDLAGSNNVTIRVGEEQSVVVHADDNLLDRVTTEVQADTLVIGNAPGTFTNRSPMSVEVSMPSLDALSLTGSGNVSASGVDARDLTVTLSGTGVVTASGTATRLDVALSGSGDAELERLVARNVHAVVSGSGQIAATAKTSLDASVSGTGAIDYGGDPKDVTTSITGSGAVSAR